MEASIARHIWQNMNTNPYIPAIDEKSMFDMPKAVKNSSGKLFKTSFIVSTSAEMLVIAERYTRMIKKMAPDQMPTDFKYDLNSWLKIFILALFVIMYEDLFQRGLFDADVN